MIKKSTGKPRKDEEIIPTTTPATHKAANGDIEKTGKLRSNRRRKQRRLLAELLSELDSLTEEEESKQEEEVEKASSSDEEIIKELHKIKRQNTITHYLLTASILATLAWQLSEISLILKIRRGLNNPLKAIGGAIKWLFSTSQEKNNDNQDSLQIIPPTYLPGIKIPDLSHIDLPGFDTSNDDDDQ